MMKFVKKFFNKKALVIGLNIGNVYCNELQKRGYIVETLDKDSHKRPTYNDASQISGNYDVVIVCTPNFTHLGYANMFKNRCKTLIIEKPGLETSAQWFDLVKSAKANVFMAKNNLFRPQLEAISELIEKNRNLISSVNIIWESKNRIPFPGGWFTEKSKSFGGVSRDIMPHLLSFAYGLADNPKFVSGYSNKEHSLSKINSTDYGVVNKNGVYDVDDRAYIQMEDGGITYHLKCAWKNDKADKQFAEIVYKDGTRLKYDFGLCPEYVYGLMLDEYTSWLVNYDGMMRLDMEIINAMDIISYSPWLSNNR